MAKVTLIKRSNPACPACNILAAMLDGEGIEHEVIDITADPNAIERFNITSVPVLDVQREGKGSIRFFGVQPIEDIKEAIGGVGE